MLNETFSVIFKHRESCKNHEFYVAAAKKKIHERDIHQKEETYVSQSLS